MITSLNNPEDGSEDVFELKSNPSRRGWLQADMIGPIAGPSPIALER